MPATPVWYCCNCDHGPWNYKLDDSCHNCHVRRCSNCRTATINQDHSYQYQKQEGTSFDASPEIHTAVRYNNSFPSVTNSITGSFDLSPIQSGRCPSASTSFPMPPTSVNSDQLTMMDDVPSAGNVFRHGGRINKCPPASLYYCCKCKDGPKLYEIQPVCINCDHKACSRCVPA